MCKCTWATQWQSNVQTQICLSKYGSLPFSPLPMWLHPGPSPSRHCPSFDECWGRHLMRGRGDGEGPAFLPWGFCAPCAGESPRRDDFPGLRLLWSVREGTPAVNAVFQRASEARVPLSLELEGDLDPDVSAGGGKEVSEQSTAAEHRPCGRHCGGNVKSLPMDGIDSVLCTNYFPPRFLYGSFHCLLQDFAQMSPSQWSLCWPIHLK